MRPDGVLVYAPPKEDELSAWQELPFVWTFGDQDVDGYYISDNGYITFDATATISEPENSRGIDKGTVRSAIFAFWADFHLEGGNPVWSNEVRSRTAGTAPNRRHVIMWISVVPKGSRWSSANASFALVLYEQGGFDIVLVSGSPRQVFGSIGAVNADASIVSLVDGSPNIPYPPLTADPNDDVRYLFSWSNAALDIAMSSLDIPPVTRVQQPVTVRGTVRNQGSTPIHSFSIAYSVDGSDEMEMDVEGTTLGSNDSYAFEHPIAFTPNTAGREYTVNVRVYNANGFAEDEVPENDELTTTVFTNLGISSPKRVLVEQFTGSWCGWCPDGSLQVASLLQQHPEAIAIAVHAGGNDAMMIIEGVQLATEFSPSYPMAMIDRTLFSGERGVPMNRGGNAWIARTSERTIEYTPLSIQVDSWHSYTPVNRIIADVTVQCSDYAPPGDYRVHCLLLRDKVIGTGSGYDQANFYSNNSSFPNHPYYSLPNPIRNYEHRHVLSMSATGTWGVPGLLPSIPQADGNYSHRFVFEPPFTPFDPDNYRVVAFVTRHGELISEREVLNVGQSTPSVLSVPAESASGFSIDGVYPQPATSTLSVLLTLERPTTVRLDIYDMLGRLVTSVDAGQRIEGQSVMQIPVNMLRNGMYVLRLHVDGAMQLYDFRVLR